MISKIITGNLILIASLILISGCGQASKDITFTSKSSQAIEFLLRGIEKHDNFYNDEARALFGKAVELDPEFAMAYYYWAITSTTTDDFLSHLSKAVDLANNSSKAERLVILSLKAQNDDSTGIARDYLEQLAALYPEGKRAHFLLGVFYFGQLEWEQAEKEMNLVVSLDPNFAAAYNLLGYAYMNMKKYPEAINALTRYSELRPEDPNPHDSMGEIYLAIGDYENSIKHYKLSLRLESDFVFSSAGLGHNYLFMGDYDKARQAYNDIFINARSTADTNTAYFWTAVSYIHEENYAMAIDVLEKQLDHARILTDIYIQATVHGQMASIYQEAGDFDKALRECANVKEIAERPDMQPGVKENYNRAYLYTEAILLTRLGKREEAQARLDEYKASAHASKNTVVIKNYSGLAGVIEYWNKNFEEAIKRLGEADPLEPYFKYYLGLCYLKTDKEDEAHSIFADIASYNRNSLSYAFVRPKATKLL